MFIEKLKSQDFKYLVKLLDFKDIYISEQKSLGNLKVRFEVNKYNYPEFALSDFDCRCVYPACLSEENVQEVKETYKEFMSETFGKAYARASAEQDASESF